MGGWLLLHYGADDANDAVYAETDYGLVHRLEVDTSGPLLVCRTLKGLEAGKKQVGLGPLQDYMVLVHGHMSIDAGVCCAPIDTSTYLETKRIRVDPSGESATTVWQALMQYESTDHNDAYTLVHCRMLTLRTHQLRVHMQHLGHPIVGDRLYGHVERPSFCPRMFVHKCRIGFFNVKGQACIEPCSLQTASDLWSALGRLRKVGGRAMRGCGAPGF